MIEHGGVGMFSFRSLPDSDRLIRCRSCQQVLAIRTPGGRRLRVLVQDYEHDETGRVDLDCPVCGQRRRVPKGGEA